MPTSDNKNRKNLPKLPVVTAVLTCKDNESTIVDCVNSLANQDYPSLQTVIIDRGSKDETCKQIESILDPDELSSAKHRFIYKDKIFYFYKTDPPIPIGQAKNIGIKSTFDSTHIFAMVTGNVEFISDKISKSVIKIMEYPNQVGIVYSDYIDHKGFIKYHRPYERIVIEKDMDLISPCFLINKAALSKVGLYQDNLDLYEDYDLALKIGVEHIIVHLPEPLYIQHD